MKYFIFKKIDRRHSFNKETQLYELCETPKYYIKRKGRIFGFLHNVGAWVTDSQGNLFCFCDYFNSIEQAESYLNCWHKETYGDTDIEVIKKIDIE